MRTDRRTAISVGAARAYERLKQAVTWFRTFVRQRDVCARLSLRSVCVLRAERRRSGTERSGSRAA
jgi:hypothetical protein